VKIALHHPDLFAFVGGLSSAIDVPRRAFTIRRLQESRYHNALFGGTGSQMRRDNDPFVLAHSVNPETAPYFFLTCGEQESLLAPNRDFTSELAQLHFKYEFHTVQAKHDWNQWNAWLPSLFQSLMQQMNLNKQP
jgi:putative tributyrin esterase